MSQWLDYHFIVYEGNLAIYKGTESAKSLFKEGLATCYNSKRCPTS